MPDELKLNDAFESLRIFTVATIEQAQDAERRAVACRRILVWLQSVRDPEHHIETLEEKKSALERDVAELEAKKKSLQGDVASLRDDHAGVQEQYDKLKGDFQKFRTNHGLIASPS